MLNAKRLTTNAKNNIKGDQKNYFRFEKLDVWHEARDFVSSFIKALGLKHLSLSN